MRYFSMFSGVGGFELGFPEEWECVGFSEIDKYCDIILKKKFPEVKNYGDTTKIRTEELPEFDMLCGGFPCQSFSIAGKRRGFEDTRGTMFFEIARILKAKRPKHFLLENVKGLLNHNKGKTYSTIISTLEELGYEFQWMVLNSKFFGVPQNRERVFIVGSIRGIPRQEILPFRENATEVSGISEEQGKIMKYKDVYGKHQQDSVYDTKGIMATIPQGTHGSTPHLTKIYHKTKEVTPFFDKDGKRIPEAHRVYDEKGITPAMKNQVSIYDRKGFDSRTKGFRENKLSPTLSKKMGTGGNNVPMVSNASPKEVGFKENSPALLSRDYKDPKIVTHSLYPRSGNPKQGGTGHLKKKDGTSYAVDTGNAQAIEKIWDNYNKTIRDDMGTLTEPHHNTHRVIENTNTLRRLTPKECERLQGFPDDWTEGVSDTQRYKMMGNAVTVNVIRALMMQFKEINNT